MAGPDLRGPSDAVARLLQGLGEVIDNDAGASIVELHWIRSLSVEDGEVDLTVTFSARTPKRRELAGQALDRLRSLMPDTDVFVHHT